MRTNLKNIGSEERHMFTGTFVRLGTKNGYKGIEHTVLLSNITDIDGNIITDYLV